MSVNNSTRVHILYGNETRWPSRDGEEQSESVELGLVLDTQNCVICFVLLVCYVQVVLFLNLLHSMCRKF